MKDSEREWWIEEYDDDLYEAYYVGVAGYFQQRYDELVELYPEIDRDGCE